jgi:hypothetical protein
MKKFTLSLSRLATLLGIVFVVGVVVGIAAVDTVLTDAGVVAKDQIGPMLQAESLIDMAMGFAIAIAVVIPPIWRTIRDAWMQRGMSQAERDRYQIERWDERGGPPNKIFILPIIVAAMAFLPGTSPEVTRSFLVMAGLIAAIFALSRWWYFRLRARVRQ